MMRPMVLEFPEDTEAPNILTQYFLGRELLVTTFNTKVYLPKSKWLDYWTGKIFTGPKIFKYQPPSNRGGGLFIRSNSIVSLSPVIQYVSQRREEGLTIEIFLEPENEANFTLYEDDGITFNYEKENFSFYHFRAIFHNGDLSIEVPKEVKIENIIAHLEEKPKQVFLNNKKLSFIWRAKDKKVEISLKDY